MQTKRTSRRPAYYILFIFISFFCAVTGFTHGTMVQSEAGKALYERHCTTCHGTDGTKGFFGAKNLKKSVLPDSAIAEQIKNGKRFMPSFSKKFTSGEIEQVILYVKTLRQH